jgi:homoaconitase/3-isopropylmalate dehydratase large subunit
MTAARTLFDKLWDSHVIATREDGEALLWVDRHFVHEGSHHAFRQVDARGRGVAEPGLTFGIADHYVPTRGRPVISDPTVADMVEQLRVNTHRHGIRSFDIADPAQGIVHVVGPEMGLTLPGLLIVCGDSHTSTHGAFGAYAFGIGASEVAHVLMTQTLAASQNACASGYEDSRIACFRQGFGALRNRTYRCGWGTRSRGRIYRLGYHGSVHGGTAHAVQHVDRGRCAKRPDRT